MFFGLKSFAASWPSFTFFGSVGFASPTLTVKPAAMTIAGSPSPIIGSSVSPGAVPFKPYLASVTIFGPFASGAFAGDAAVVLGLPSAAGPSLELRAHATRENRENA